MQRRRGPSEHEIRITAIKRDFAERHEVRPRTHGEHVVALKKRGGRLQVEYVLVKEESKSTTAASRMAAPQHLADLLMPTH